MSDENEQINDDNDPIRVEVVPNGVPTLAALFPLAALIGLLVALFIHDRRDKVTADSPDSARYCESQAAQDQAQTAYHQRMLELETKVVEACVAGGQVPVWNGNYIDCKK